MVKLGVLAHERKQLGRGLGELRRLLTDVGMADPPWRQVDKSKKAPKQVRKLLDAGVDRLLVWGGDGTVRRCIDTVVQEGADVEVAILPAGTANLLAHGLGIPIDLPAAVDVAVHGHCRRIDVGRMNGESFCVMAGTGFDARLIRDADDGKDRWGPLAYVKAGVRNLANDGARVRIDVDGQPWFDGDAACVLVGNLGRVLGGIEVFPDARADDGRLDVGVVQASSRRDWLRVGVRAVTGRIDASPLVEVTQATTIRFKLDEPMPWQLDGGDRSPAKKFEVEVLPRRLAVCVPVSP